MHSVTFLDQNHLPSCNPTAYSAVLYVPDGYSVWIIALVQVRQYRSAIHTGPQTVSVSPCRFRLAVFQGLS